MSEIVRRADAATAKYGTYTSSHEALGVITEEYQELIAAIRNNDMGAIKNEATDLAACCLKLSWDCQEKTFIARSQK